MDNMPRPAISAKPGRPVTSDAGGNRDASRIENPDALLVKPALSNHQEEHESLDGIGKPMERHNTWESESSSLARTSTGFSHMSSVTAMTELTEPDLATSHDDAEDVHASHTRRFTLPCRSRTSTFQSSPPSRTSSIAIDRSAAQLGRRPVTHENVPGRPHPLSHSIPEQGDDDDEMDFQPSSPHQSVHKGTPADPGDDLVADGPPPEEAVIKSEDDNADGDWTPAELSSSQMSDGSNCHPFDHDTALQMPDEKLVNDVSDKLLNHLFGVDLQDLSAVDAASAAHQSISNCLHELFQIVHTSLAPFGSVSVARGNGEPNQGLAPSYAGASSSNGASGSTNGNGNGRGSKRRQNGNGHPGDDELGGEDGPGDHSKKPRLDQSSEAKSFSCPFRKRNPVRFNVRDHQNCAVNSFPDISQLKRHVKIFHGRKVMPGFPCPRCKQTMGSQEALNHHISVSNDLICTVQEHPASGNPEDGIDAKVEDLLNGRRANTKVDSWDILWKTLFPCDDIASIPDHTFVPPIEFDEVLADFRATPYRDELKRQIYEEIWSSKPDCEAEARVDALVETCRHHIELALEACRSAKLGNHPNRERRRRIQKSKPRHELVSQSSPASVLPMPHEASNLGESNGNSPASMGTAHSGGSWSHVNQSVATAAQVSSMSLDIAAAIPPNRFSAIPNTGISAGVVLSSPISPDDTAQTPVLTRGGFPSHRQLHHNRGSSADSAVDFERGLAIAAGNMDMYQRAPVFSPPQATFTDLDFSQTSAYPVPGPHLMDPGYLPYDMNDGSYGVYQHPGLDRNMGGGN